MRVLDLQRRVERACIELVDEGRQLTVGEVAARAQVGKATIYRRPELRALVDEHRARGREALTLTGLAVQVDQLRQSLEAVAAKVRRHEELLRRIDRRSRSSA
jgi:AcrR family transcriptional regulator